MLTRRRFQFSLFSVLAVMTIVGVSIAVLDYPRRRKAATIRVYEQQKDVVWDAAEEFVAVLKSEGYSVTKHSTRENSGSGEWRYHVEFQAEKDRQEERGLIEVMGFVSHNLKGEPDWFDILPMRITCHGGTLDERFAEFLQQRLQAKKWKVEIVGRKVPRHLPTS